MANKVHKIKKALRFEVYKLTQGICWYCGQLATTVDHALPLSRKGSRRIHNLLPCCGWCNGKKENKTIQEFRFWLMKPGNNNVIRVLTGGEFWGERNNIPLPKKPRTKKIDRTNCWIYSYLGIEKMENIDS